MSVSLTADRIKTRRKELGLSADVIAEAVGVSRATMFRYENGDIEKVPVSVIPLLAVALHTTPSYLMGWDEEPATGNTSKAAEKKPTPVSERGRHINIVKIAGRDGSYKEKRLTDEQIKALQTIIDQMPEAPEDL